MPTPVAVGERGANGLAPVTQINPEIPPLDAKGPITDPARLLESKRTPNATGNIVSEKLDDSTVMYRAHGGESGPVGGFYPPTKPTSGAQAISESALPPGNAATKVSTVRIPAGTRIQRSTASPAFGQDGGGPQIELLERVKVVVIKTEELKK